MRNQNNTASPKTSKEVLDSLCVPMMRMPVYQAEGGSYFVDEEQSSAFRSYAFKPENRGCPLVGQVVFHPLNSQEPEFRSFI